MSQKWSLGNRRENTVENNLQLESLAQKIITLLKSDDGESLSENLLVWTSGWNAWKNYSEVPEICNEIDQLNIKAGDAPPPLDFSSVPPLPTSLPKIFNNEISDKKSASKEKEPLASTNKKEVFAHKSHSTQITSKPIPASNNMVNNRHTPTKSNPVMPPSQNSNTPAMNIEKPTANSATTTSSTTPAKNSMPNPKRKHNRVFARFKCIIRSSSLTFRTFTHDISLGGVSLEDEIPADLIGIECMIYIASTKTHKHLKFKIAPTERCVAKYFSFQDADQVILKELSEWIETHQKLSSAS